MLHKDYNHKWCSVGKYNYCVVSLKGLVAKTNWLTVTMTDSDYYKWEISLFSYSHIIRGYICLATEDVTKEKKNKDISK
jgi:hypothetical protein